MKIILVLFFLFLSTISFGQLKYLTGADSISYILANNMYKIVYVNISDSTDSVKDTVFFEVYSKAFKTWKSARMLNLHDGATIGADSVLVLADGAFGRYMLTEEYPSGFRVKRRNRAATKRMGVEIVPIKEP